MARPEIALALKGMAWQEEASAGVELNICIVNLADASVSCYGQVPEICGSNLDSSRPSPIVVQG